MANSNKTLEDRTYFDDKVDALIERGRPFVKKESLRDWHKDLIENVTDINTASIIDQAIQGMKLLSKGKSPKDVIDKMYKDQVTGYIMQPAIEAIVQYHKRGEEMRLYWNNHKNS